MKWCAILVTIVDSLPLYRSSKNRQDGGLASTSTSSVLQLSRSPPPRSLVELRSSARTPLLINDFGTGGSGSRTPRTSTPSPRGIYSNFHEDALNDSEEEEDSVSQVQVGVRGDRALFRPLVNSDSPTSPADDVDDEGSRAQEREDVESPPFIAAENERRRAQASPASSDGDTSPTVTWLQGRSHPPTPPWANRGETGGDIYESSSAAAAAGTSGEVRIEIDAPVRMRGGQREVVNHYEDDSTEDEMTYEDDLIDAQQRYLRSFPGEELPTSELLRHDALQHDGATVLLDDVDLEAGEGRGQKRKRRPKKKQRRANEGHMELWTPAATNIDTRPLGKALEAAVLNFVYTREEDVQRTLPKVARDVFLALTHFISEQTNTGQVYDKRASVAAAAGVADDTGDDAWEDADSQLESMHSQLAMAPVGTLEMDAVLLEEPVLNPVQEGASASASQRQESKTDSTGAAAAEEKQPVVSFAEDDSSPEIELFYAKIPPQNPTAAGFFPRTATYDPFVVMLRAILPAAAAAGSSGDVLSNLAQSISPHLNRGVEVHLDNPKTFKVRWLQFLSAMNKQQEAAHGEETDVFDSVDRSRMWDISGPEHDPKYFLRLWSPFECSVCCEKLLPPRKRGEAIPDGERLAVLDCFTRKCAGCVYHQGCINGFVQNQYETNNDFFCPVCRFDIADQSHQILLDTGVIQPPPPPPGPLQQLMNSWTNYWSCRRRRGGCVQPFLICLCVLAMFILLPPMMQSVNNYPDWPPDQPTPGPTPSPSPPPYNPHHHGTYYHYNQHPSSYTSRNYQDLFLRHHTTAPPR